VASAGIKRSYIQGARLTEEISYHKPNSGGVTVGIYGSKGSGKTTFLLTLAQTICCENPFTHNEEKETVLWRGRSNDYWNWIPKEQVQIFIHKTDFDRAIFKDDILNTMSKEDLPPMEAYTSIRQLYSRLRAGKINVVYEPTTYSISDRIKKMIQKRGISGDELFKSNEVDPVIFWFEFMDWLVHNKNPKFISIVFDEADELFPASPGGARWHLNLWAKDVIKDLRRRRISLFMACHGYQDLDGRIKPKIQYKVWMKGSVTMPESLVNRQAPLMLEPGVFYIERDGWGMHSFDKIEERTIVLSYLDGCDERDDFGDTSKEDLDEKALPPLPQKLSDIIKPETRVSANANISVPSECIYYDADGKMCIDLTKFNTATNGKSKKKSRPKPIYHKRSYIQNRSTANDDKIENARAYDERVESGEISEEPLPKYDRNDNTTDEVDK
jgi:DNA polymerase III delta prime subunit